MSDSSFTSSTDWEMKACEQFCRYCHTDLPSRDKENLGGMAKAGSIRSGKHRALLSSPLLPEQKNLREQTDSKSNNKYIFARTNVKQKTAIPELFLDF